MTNQPPLIYGQMAKLLGLVGPIAKEQHNKGQNYKFRGIDQVYDALHPCLAECGIFLTSKVLGVRTTSDGRMNRRLFRMEFTFWAEDGSSVTTQAIGEGFDTSDKASNKAMSAAYKYALFQSLCIPTEAVDGDAETPMPPPQKRQQPKKSRVELTLGKIHMTQSQEELLAIDGNAWDACEKGTLSKEDFAQIGAAIEMQLAGSNGNAKRYVEILTQRGVR